MKPVNIVRLLVCVAVIGIFSWLHWKVLPQRGIFKLDVLANPIPETGFSLILYEDGKNVSAYALSMVKTGWGMVEASWPFVLLGVVFGVTLGYPFGELTRRRLVVEQMDEDSREENQALLRTAYEKKYDAENKSRKANALYLDASRVNGDTMREWEKIHQLRMTLEEQSQVDEMARHKAAALEKELAKAKAKIRRLEKIEDRPSEKNLPEHPQLNI